MSGNFSDTPLTIGEARVNRSHKAEDWKPRDALLHTLRQIDSGEVKPEGLVIVWYERNDDGTIHSTVLRQATKDEITTSGLLLSGLRLS